jgi:hypothetical protein
LRILKENKCAQKTSRREAGKMEMQKVNWETSYEKALDQAKKEEKLVLLDFFKEG